MKHKRVAIVASVASMIGQFNMRNISLLQEMGCEVHVICNFREGNTCDAATIQKLRHTLSGMRVYQHAWDCPRRCLPGKCISAYASLCGIFRKYPFTLIHCHSPIGGALARMAAYRFGIPVIYTAHGFHFYQGAPWKNWLLYYPAEKLLSRLTHVLITVNQEDERFARRYLHAGEVYRIPGVGVDSSYFSRKDMDGAEKAACRNFRRRYRIPEDAVLLLSVGELNKGKNHRTVLKAIAMLEEEEREKLCYLICGQGALKGRLAADAAKLQISRQVRLAGYVADIRPAYQAADLFLFPSMREGMPVALMEAMAAGLAVVASKIRGNQELIRKEGGLLVHPRDAQGFARAVRKLADWKTGMPQKLEAMGAYNRRQILKYDQCVVDQRMRDIYREAVHRRDKGTWMIPDR